MISKAQHERNAVHEQLWCLASTVRDSCFIAATTAYEDARIDGLCHDGAWECALEAMRDQDFESIITKVIAGR